MIENLNIGEKTQNQGVNAAGKLTAEEFNSLVSKVKELISHANKTIYLSQEQYDALVEGGEIQNDVEYNVYEE